MSKPEKKVYLASQPFICKSNARIILSINHKAMDNIWETIKTEYKKDYGVDVPSYGVPTKYFLEKVHISRDEFSTSFRNRKKAQCIGRHTHIELQALCTLNISVTILAQKIKCVYRLLNKKR